MNDLNLYHLRYFVDAAREGGISQSARKNFVTQSAVSRAIASLEQGLGAALVVHGQNRFQLTETGEAVLEKSQSVFEAVAGLKDSALSGLKAFRGPLRFGCNQAIASRLVAPALTRLAAKHPDVKPVLRIGNTDQVQRMLDSRELDFGIVVDDGEVSRHYQIKRVCTGKLLVVKSPGLRLKEPFENLVVSRIQKGSLSQRFFNAYEKAHGVSISPKLVVSSWQVILDLAIAGYGPALVPEFLCEEALRSKKLEIMRSNKMKPVLFDLCTIVPKARLLPRNAQALFECMETAG